MKQFTTAILLALALTVSSAPVRASLATVAADDYDDSQSHPLRIAAYLLHPVGYTLEWLVFRPFHRLVSQPDTAPIFGHRPHAQDASIGTR